MSRGRFGEDNAGGRRCERSAGFTLLELLVVLGILSILAAAGIPNFIKFVYKSRRAEAYQALRAVYVLQVQYQAETGVFADTFDELGFWLEGATRVDARTIQGPYYTYTLLALPLNGKPRRNYRALATGDIDPTDPVLDILMIENRLTVVNPAS
jgi:prepilin-type N-terminal cleavage/methylation domain-containing protein